MVDNPKKPHIVLFGDVLSVEMMPRLYAAADCYVLPTRGEGHGMPYQESAACGLPVIATRYSGQTDFLDDDNSYLIDVDGFYCAKQDLAWISYFYEDQEFPILGPKAVEQLRYLMRRVYENRAEADEKARKLRHKVVTEYDWSTCVDKMHAKLRQTFDILAAK
jgi:glycosyltransferase involved in cell wall biosynthesis